MKFVEQTYMTCGQACVAMIAGISLKKAIEVVGKKGGTTTKDLVKALRKLGFKCGDRLKFDEPVFLAIVKEKFAKHEHEWDWHWHWVVYYNGNYYDPGRGVNPKLPKGRRYSSCLEIRKQRFGH